MADFLTKPRWTSLVAIAAVVAFVAGGVLVFPGRSFAASPVERFAFEDFEFFETVCGDIDIRISGTFVGTMHSQPKGRDKLLYFMENGHGFHDYTNLGTGKTMRAVDNGAFKDVRVEDNGDGTLSILAQYSGGTSFYGPDGERLGGANGVTAWAWVVDHAGTPLDPDDDILISEDVVRQAGPRIDDFCAFFRQATT